MWRTAARPATGGKSVGAVRLEPAALSSYSHDERLTTTALLPGTEHARAIRERRITARALAELYIRRVTQHNPALHAIVIGNEREALEAARERDEEFTRDLVRGPLHGVPVPVREMHRAAWCDVCAAGRILTSAAAPAFALRASRRKPSAEAPNAGSTPPAA